MEKNTFRRQKKCETSISFKIALTAGNLDYFNESNYYQQNRFFTWKSMTYGKIRFRITLIFLFYM